MKQYVISYKVRGIPFWYVFTCYAENTDNAVAAFIKEYPIGIETYRIVKTIDI